jgi:cell division protein FtsB
MDGKARMARFFSQLLMILLGIVVVFLVVDFGRTVVESQQQYSELKELKAERDAVYAEQKELQDAVRYAYSVQAVEDWSREIGLVKDDEIGVTIIDYNEAPVAPVRESPRTTPASIPARRVWWDLFFAER